MIKLLLKYLYNSLLLLGGLALAGVFIFIGVSNRTLGIGTLLPLTIGGFCITTGIVNLRNLRFKYPIVIILNVVAAILLCSIMFLALAIITFAVEHN